MMKIKVLLPLSIVLLALAGRILTIKAERSKNEKLLKFKSIINKVGEYIGILLLIIFFVALIYGIIQFHLRLD